MPRYLFPGFRESDQQFAECEGYWDTLLREVERSLGQEGRWRAWVDNRRADGTLVELNFRSVCSRVSDRLDRAFRIEQEPPPPVALRVPDVSAWVKCYDRPEYLDTVFPSAELFIGLTLSEEALSSVRAMLQAWMAPETTPAEMEAFIRDLPDVELV